MLLLTKCSGFINNVRASKAGIWVDSFLVPKHQNILAVIENNSGKLLIPGANIVTDVGDIYYAQLGASEAVTNAFSISELASAGTPGKAANRSGFTTIAGTQKVHSATYPKTNDPDVDNTGAAPDVVTYLASYTKADFSAANITHGIITNVTPGASEVILTGYAFSAAFGKTINDTLKVFVNHNANGV